MPVATCPPVLEGLPLSARSSTRSRRVQTPYGYMNICPCSAMHTTTTPIPNTTPACPWLACRWQKWTPAVRSITHAGHAYLPRRQQRRHRNSSFRLHLNSGKASPHSSKPPVDSHSPLAACRASRSCSSLHMRPPRCVSHLPRRQLPPLHPPQMRGMRLGHALRSALRAHAWLVGGARREGGRRLWWHRSGSFHSGTRPVDVCEVHMPGSADTQHARSILPPLCSTCFVGPFPAMPRLSLLLLHAWCDRPARMVPEQQYSATSHCCNWLHTRISSRSSVRWTFPARVFWQRVYRR